MSQDERRNFNLSDILWGELNISREKKNCKIQMQQYSDKCETSFIV